MKSKFLFSILILLVIALIVLAAKLTTDFFDLSNAVTEIDKSLPLKEELPVDQKTTVVSETIIEAITPVPSRKPEERRPIEQKAPETPQRIPMPQHKPDMIVAEKPEVPEETVLSKKDKRAGIGTVRLVKGKVTGTRKNMVRRELHIHARIFLNEQIETGPKSNIEISFDDNSTISQGENSAIMIDEYVYEPKEKKKSGFGMRLIKGMCRVVTGVITDINPKRFHVKTRMATIGIRGCELAFRTTDGQDDIYVIGLSGEKVIVVEASKSGKYINNMHTGKPIPKGRTDLTTFTISESRQLLSVINGKGADQKNMTPADLRGIMKGSSNMLPADFEMQNSKSGAVFLLKPQSMPEAK